MKQCKTDILLITGVLSSYANVVEKLHRDLEKSKATLLKIERAGDVLLQAVSSKINIDMNTASNVVPNMTILFFFCGILGCVCGMCNPHSVLKSASNNPLLEVC